MTQGVPGRFLRHNRLGREPKAFVLHPRLDMCVSDPIMQGVIYVHRIQSVRKMTYARNGRREFSASGPKSVVSRPPILAVRLKHGSNYGAGHAHQRAKKCEWLVTPSDSTTSAGVSCRRGSGAPT
jgi:hypothetical protein